MAETHDTILSAKVGGQAARPKRAKPTGLPIVHEHAAGIDIGSRFHVAAVSPDRCDEPVQTFQAFTSDLERMASGSLPLASRR